MKGIARTLAVFAALSAGAALRADEGTRSFADAEHGLKVTVPVAYEVATKGYKHSPQDALCEVTSPDGEVHGYLAFIYGAGSAARIADEWEEGWKGKRGVSDVKRVSEETPKREGASWLKREVTLAAGSEKRHYTLAFAERGSRVAELVVACKEGAFEAKKKELAAIADSLEFKRQWLCPSCGKDTGPDAAKCECGAALVAEDPELAKLAKQFHIQVVSDSAKAYPFKCAGERVVAKAAPADAVRVYSERLVKELRRYPDAVFEKLLIERIVFCKDLFGGSMRRGALVDPSSDSIHYDVLEGKATENFQVLAIHHELFHVMDSRMGTHGKTDAAWEACNTKGFKYASRKKDSPFDGFASLYGMTSPGEDKAEVFANLMVRPKWCAERAAKDDVFRLKVERMKKTLAAWIPALDEKFWAKGE